MNFTHLFWNWKHFSLQIIEWNSLNIITFMLLKIVNLDWKDRLVVTDKQSLVLHNHLTNLKRLPIVYHTNLSNVFPYHFALIWLVFRYLYHVHNWTLLLPGFSSYNQDTTFVSTLTQISESSLGYWSRNQVAQVNLNRILSWTPHLKNRKSLYSLLK